MPPWIPKPGALRRWRDFRRLTVPDLCKRTRNKNGRHGVNERTVRKLESKKPYKTIQDATVGALVKALTDEGAGIVCRPEFLAWWRNSDGTIAPGDPKWIDPTLSAAVAVSPTAPIKRKSPATASTSVTPAPVDTEIARQFKAALKRRPRGAPQAPVSVESEPSGLELQRPLTSNAEVERAIGRHADVVTLPTGTYPLVGCDWLHELETQYAEYVGKTFAVVGLVRDTRPIPQRAVTVLNAESGRGATYVKIGRIASGRDSHGGSHHIDVWPTVFAPKGEHGKALLAAHREKLLVTVLVRIVIAERKVGATRDDTWEGFFWYEKGKPSPKPWAFVSDEVITGEVFVQPSRSGGKRRPVFAPGGIQIE